MTQRGWPRPWAPIRLSLEAVLHGGTGASAALRLAVASRELVGFSDVVRPFLLKDVGTCEQVAAELGADTGPLGAVAARPAGSPVDVAGD